MNKIELHQALTRVSAARIPRDCTSDLELLRDYIENSEPVKSGRWIWVKNYHDCEGDIYSQYKCSYCDFVVSGIYSDEDLTHFCGNCGVKMNKGGK